MRLREALLGCSSSQLARIAAAWRLDVEAGTLRRELVDLAAVRIAAEVERAETWADLAEAARRVLGLVTRAGGRYEAELLARRLARSSGGGGAADGRAQDVERAVVGLTERGLLLRIYEAEEQRQGVYLLMPDEVLTAGRQHLAPGRDEPQPATIGQPERTVRVHLATDLFVLASALRREAWGAASRGLARRPALTVGQILARLRRQPDDGPGDPGRRWRFLLWVAQRAGWIRRDSWPTPDDDAIARLLGAPESLPALALAAGPTTEGTAPGPVRERSVSRRRQADALQLLGELRDGDWWTGPALAAWLAEGMADDPDGAPTGRTSRARRVEDQLGRWLTGRWFWLGLVAWAWDGAGWSLASPTPALRALTTGRPLEVTTASRPCNLDGTLRLEAPPDADLALLYRVEPYLAFAGTEDGVRRYSLTPASLERGLRLGGEADDLRELLTRLAQAELGPEWSAAIDDWSSGASRLRLAARLVLSSDREETLADALRTVAGLQVAAEHIAPGHALVAGEQVAELLGELARAGLPVEIDPGLRAEPASTGRAAAVSAGIAETAWVALEVLRRLAPDVVGEQRDLRAARGSLEAVLGAGALEALGRRAATIAAAIADRRRTRGRVRAQSSGSGEA